MKAFTVDAKNTVKKKMNMPTFSPMPSCILFRSLERKESEGLHHLKKSPRRKHHSLGHPGSEITGLVGIVPSHLLPQNRLQEEVPDQVHLVLRGIVQACDKDPTEDPHGQSDDGRATTELGNLGKEILLRKEVICKRRAVLDEAGSKESWDISSSCRLKHRFFLFDMPAVAIETVWKLVLDLLLVPGVTLLVVNKGVEKVTCNARSHHGFQPNASTLSKLHESP